MKLKYLKKKHLVQVGLFIGLCVFSFFFIFPIYWAVTMSFKYNEDILTTVPQYIPTRVTTTHYIEIFRKSNFPTFLFNSAKIATLTTLLCVLVASMAGFGLTRFRFKGSKTVSFGIYVIRMIPGLLYTIPLYIIYLNLGLLDNPFGLIAAYCTFSLLPSISVVAILCFIGAWNEFGLALTLTFRDEAKTLPIAINTMIQRDRDTPFGSIAAAGTLSMVPAIILSLTMQKYIVKGFTAGAVKG